MNQHENDPAVMIVPDDMPYDAVARTALAFSREHDEPVWVFQNDDMIGEACNGVYLSSKPGVPPWPLPNGVILDRGEGR